MSLRSRMYAPQSLPYWRIFFGEARISRRKSVPYAICSFQRFHITFQDFAGKKLRLGILQFLDWFLIFFYFQKKIFHKNVFCLENGSANFATIQALIEFYKLNLTKPLPCYLTESPFAQRSAWWWKSICQQWRRWH